MGIEKVKVAADAKSKSYYHFFERKMVDVPADKKEILKHPYGKLGEGMEIEDRNHIFDKKITSGEVGIFPLKNGGFSVANKTIYKGVKGEMLQWFFGWHATDPLRYAIWDCYDHHGLEISEKDRAYILNPKTSIPDKCRNVHHRVLESLIPGEKPSTIDIYFADPKDLGYDTSKIFTDACSFFVCANAEIVTPKILPNMPVVMTHMAVDTEDGCELRSRFWMGYKIVDGVGKRCGFPEFLLKKLSGIFEKLLEHNFYEYTNLGVILPQLYAEEKDTW